jgi:F0F1-type ATP synthase alpha subunit
MLNFVIQFNHTSSYCDFVPHVNDETRCSLTFRKTLTSLILSPSSSNVQNEENNSLLHYLVVWGYSAGIQLLEIESTWKTTLTNKRNYTPVHFAAYLSRHKFPELLLKKTENVKRSKSLQKLKNRIPGECSAC